MRPSYTNVVTLTCHLQLGWEDTCWHSFFSYVRFDATCQPSWQKSRSSWTQSHGSWCSFSRQTTCCEVLSMFWGPGYRDDPTLPCQGTVCEPLESMRRECLYRWCSGPSVGHEPTCPSSLWGFTKLGCGGKQFCHCKTKGYFHYLFIYLFIIPCIYHHSIVQWLLKWSVSAKL